MRKRTKFNKFFSVLLAVLMLFSAFPIASFAISEGDTVKVSGTSDWISGFYYNFGGNFGTGKHGQHQRIRANGQVAYCVEPGKSLSSGNKTAREEWNGLTYEQQNLVKAALIYGYNGTTKYGYSDDTEEVATQTVIWAIALNAFNNGSEELLLSCAFGGSTNSTNRANGREVYYRIKEQIRVHYTIPSFTTNRSTLAGEKKITLKYNSSTGKYEGSVYDNNGVLSGYTFNLNGVTFTKSGNTLNISTTKVLKNATVSGERTSNYYCNSLPALAAIYCLGKDQTTVTTINRKDPVNAYFTLETESVGNVKLVKTSEDGKVDNVLMHISGNGIEKDVRTGKDGTITVENLIAGTYTSTEKVDDLYVPQTAQTFTISPGKTTTVTFNNRLKRGSLEVMKVAEDGKVEGYTFRISGTAISGEIIDFTLTTGADGKAKKDGIPIGTYTIEETNCPSYMVQPDNQSITIKHNETTNVSFTNNFKRGNLFLAKVDEDTGDVIVNNDARFAVYEYSNVTGKYGNYICDLTYTDALDASEYGYTEGYLATYLPITGENEGKYRIIEISAPSDYVTDGASYDVVLQENNEIVFSNVTNKIQKGKITLKKTDAETGKAVAGATYELYAKEDILANGVLKHHKGDLIATLVTGHDGTATTEALYLGAYYVKEKFAPDGWVLDKDIHDIVLTYDANSPSIFIQSETVSDMPQKGRISITKYDETTGKTIAAPAKYGVYAASDIVVNGDVKYTADTLVDTVTTSDNGKGLSNLLYLGRYYLKELSAPEGFNKNNNTYYVTLLYHGQDVSVFTEEIKDYDTPQYGKINITKIDEETGDLLLAPVRFNIIAAEDIIVNGDLLHFKGEIVASLTTLYGQASTDWLPLGKYFVQEAEATAPYVIDKTLYPVSLTYDAQSESVQFSQTIVNKPQKAVITVSKVDTESGIPVQGAVYEIKAAEDIRVNGDLKYRKNQTVDTVTTNANGIAVSKALYLGKYVVQEKSVPKPFVLDKTSHNVELIYHNSELEIFNETLQVSDMPQKAIIKLHKVDSETQKSLANAVYEIYANEDITVNGDLKYLKGTLVDTVTTDADGLAYSKELYLGSYRAVEKTAPYAYVLDTDEHIATLEYQGQEVEIFTQGYTVENAPQKAKIELLKVDKETRRSIEKAVYELYAKSDIILNGDVKYPAGTLIETLTTNKDGKATTKPLYLGEYYLLEKTAPYGYVLNPEKIDVTLTYKGQNVPEYTEYVTAEDLAQKGTIRVTKSGESLITVTKDDDIYTPVYADKGLQGAVFNIVAAEDIYTGDGTLRARNGDVVDTITTDANGVAESKELYLGRYKAVEVKAPHGMVINYSPAFVELTYAGQYETLTFAETSVYNERQKATVELQKALEQDDLFNIGDNEEILNVRFGLYAAETIIALDGTQIPKDGLLEIATSDETGHIEFNCDIPIGKYYVREYATDEHYILSDSKYPVAFDYAGESVLAIRISANDGVAVDNEIVRGNILGKKVDDNGEPVVNAVLGLFNTETTEFTEETALLVSVTNEEGVFAFEDVAFGNYVVREIAAPEGYVLSTVSTPVTISEQAQTVEITVLNSIITGSVSVVKVDEEDYTNKLCGAKFEIFVDTNANGVFDEDVDTLYGELTDGNDGTYFLDGLQYNGYFLHETEAPTGFLKDDNYYYFEIRNDGETVTVSNVLFDASDDAENAEASQGEENTENNAPSVFTNRPIKGVLEITKTDAENGSLIPNTGFRIRDLDGNIIAEGYTDENGVVTFTLRYGKYTYEEFEAAPGYILDEQKHEFEVKEDGVVIQVNATNDLIPVEIPKTGRKENAGIALLSSLSFLSVTLYFSLKKRKRLIGGAE